MQRQHAVAPQTKLRRNSDVTQTKLRRIRRNQAQSDETQTKLRRNSGAIRRNQAQSDETRAKLRRNQAHSGALKALRGTQWPSVSRTELLLALGEESFVTHKRGRARFPRAAPLVLIVPVTLQLRILGCRRSAAAHCGSSFPFVLDLRGGDLHATGCVTGG